MPDKKRGQKILGEPEIGQTPKDAEPENEKVLARPEGGKTMKIEAFPKRKMNPPLPYEALEFPNKMKIVDARAVETRYGVRKVVEIELLSSEYEKTPPGRYTLWCSRLGIERLFEQLGEIYDDPRGMVVEIREAGKVGRAYNYTLEILEGG